MKPKFSICGDNLIFTKDGQKEVFSLPQPQSELVGIPAFIKDLNRRAEKIKGFTAEMIKTNSHYVFIEHGSATIRVKFPKVKEKHLLVDKATHKMAKEQAAKSGLPVKDYIHLCLVRCESDIKDLK